MTNITESYNLQSPLKVEIEWCRQSDTPPITLSISALLLNKETNLVDKMEDFVFYGTPTNDGKNITTKGGGIKCDSLNFKKGFGTGAKYNMTIDLKKIDTEISKIRIIASIVPKDTSDKDVPGFDNLSKARFILTDGVGSVYKCDLEREADALCRSVDIAIVQRWDKNWRFSEELNFHMGYLVDVYNDNSYVNERVSETNPFSLIGDIFEIEQSYERHITIDERHGVKKYIEKFTKRFVGKQKEPEVDPFFKDNFPQEPEEKRAVDPFFQNEDGVKVTTGKEQSGKDQIKDTDFSFGDKESKTACNKNKIYKDNAEFDFGKKIKAK